MLFTPFLPAFRSQLAALGKRTSSSLRQLDFLPLCEKFRDLIPIHLLASEEEGSGSRDRERGQSSLLTLKEVSPHF